MSKVVFDRKKQKEESLIPNKQIEQMFLLIANDEQMKNFTDLVDKGLSGTATAYASQRVYKTFMYWRDNFIARGGSLDDLQYLLYRKNK